MTEMLSFDTTVKLVEIASILIGGGMVAGGIRANSRAVKEAMALQEKRLEALENDVKALNRVITEVAVQNSRIHFLEQRVEELRHGDGIVLTSAARQRLDK